MDRPDAPRLSRVQRWLVGIVASGAVAIAGIGFAGSYAAVRRLAIAQGFGSFAQVFPVGVDAGIVVLLALDLLLTWLRIPFPLLRYTAWLLTAATIAFNGAAAWPDPIGVGMHGVIPLLFVVVVEAARHATGRIADITARKAMDSIRVSRWILAPWPTFRLWRRMKLWELRSYDTVVALEQKRLTYRAQLIAEYGWGWRWSAPIEKRMPLRLARYGIPVSAPARSHIICVGPSGALILQPPAALTAPAQNALTGPSNERVLERDDHAHDERPAEPHRERGERAQAERPRKPAPERAHRAQRPSKKSAPKTVTDRRRERTRRLYDDLGKRPEWTEIRDALVAERLAPKTISRPTCQRIRDAIEKKEPKLVALGSPNVRPLTGS